MLKLSTKRNKNVRITIYDALCGTGKSCAAIKDINSTYDRVIVITPLKDEMSRYVRECPRLTQPVGKYKGGGKADSSRDLIEQGLSFVTSHELAKRWLQADYKAIKEKGYRLIMDESIDFISPYDPFEDRDSTYEMVLNSDDIPPAKKARILESLAKPKRMKPKDIKCFVKYYCNVDEQTGLLDLKTEEDENGEPVEVESATFARLIELVKEHRLVYDEGNLLRIMPPEFLKAFDDIKILTYMFNKLPSASYMKIFDFRWADGYISSKMTFTDVPGEARINTVDYASLVKIWDETVDKRMVKLNAIGSGDFPLSATAYKERMSKDEAKKVFNNMHNWVRNYARLKTSQMFFISYSCSVDENDKNRCFYSSPSMREKYKKRHLACNIKATNQFGDCTGVAYLINRYSAVSVLNYCKNKGHPYTHDDFATSEMIQALFRSALRKGEPIDVYMPSSRMRELLKGWLKKQTEFLSTLEYDENGVLIMQPYS